MLATARDFNLVAVKIGIDGLLQPRFSFASRYLRPAQEAIIDGFIVVDSNLNSNVAIGNEKLGLLWIERHPTQVAKPDLDPGVATLSHLESEYTAFPGDIEGLVEGYAIYYADRNGDRPHQSCTQMREILAVSFARLQAVEGVIFCWRSNIAHIVYYPGEYALDRIKLGGHILSEFFGQFPYARIIRLYLFGRREIG